MKIANIFRYTIYCGDYSLGGYSESVTYSGTDRNKAVNAYHEAKDWLGMVRVKLSVLGRENHDRHGMIDSDDEFNYIDDEDSVDCYIFEDGIRGFVNPFSDTPNYDLDIFQEYAGHGKATFHYVGTAEGEYITGWVEEFDTH